VISGSAQTENRFRLIHRRGQTSYLLRRFNEISYIKISMMGDLACAAPAK
jgi:hypothetical protein